MMCSLELCVGTPCLDMYGNTYDSFIDMIVGCSNKVPLSDFVTKINSDLFQLDKEFYSDKTLPLMDQTEQKIETVYNSGLPLCAQEFTKKLADTTSTNEPNYYFTFKFLWLSILSGLNDCNTSTDTCMIKNGDDNTFLLRYIQYVISEGASIPNSLSCFSPTNKNCTDALKAIVEQDGFTSKEYSMQIETLKIALKGVKGHLEKIYSDWAEGNKDCEDLLIKTCLGKPIYL